MNSETQINLTTLYLRAMRIRAVELLIAEKYCDQRMRCPVHLSVGQELVPSAFGELFDSDIDACFSAHRSHAHYLALNGNLRAMFGELLGKKFGCAGGKGGSMHLIDLQAGLKGAVPIVGSSIPMAVGYAHANKILDKAGVVIVFLGDGATEEGVFAESLDYAALHALRIVFVIEANKYSVYTGLAKRQFVGRDVTKISEAHGVRPFEADGYDIDSVVTLTETVMASVRRDEGPVTVSFDTYRWLEHCGPDDDDQLNYRPLGELQSWIDKCPLKELAQKLDQSAYDETLSRLRNELLVIYEECDSAEAGFSISDVDSNVFTFGVSH